MKKVFLFCILLATVVFGQLAFAQTPVTPTLNTTIVPACQDPNSVDCYTLIEPLPGNNGVDVTSIDLATTGGTGGLGGFINFAMEIGIGIAGVLGVVMLVIYGFQYAAEDKNVGNFTILKDKITKVVLGLMLLLGITIILRTINPDLLIVEPDISMVDLHVEDYNYTPAQSAQILDNYFPNTQTGASTSTITGSGVLSHSRIINKIAPNIEKGNRNTIAGIVLHRTAGKTAASALATWLTPGVITGAHFIIDANGVIWQTARINKVTYSNGNTQVRGISNDTTISIEVTGSCWVNVGGVKTNCVLKAIEKYIQRPLKLTYWDVPTAAQIDSTKFLINYLHTNNGVPLNLYAHGEISDHKTFNEASDILRAVR
jgi:hypothetical protein